MAQDSSPRVFAVLGATGGIGSAVARQLAQQGQRLVVGARGSDRLSALGEELGAVPFELDATEFSGVDACLNRAVDEFGRLDGVVNCVGSLLLKPAHLTSEQEWEQIVSVNLKSAFGVVRAAAKAMIKTGGSVVLISSAAAELGLSNHEAIAAAKAGVCGLVRAAAATYGPRDIRVNAVAPGLVQTPLTERITGSEAAAAASLKLHALHRFGRPQEVAQLICYLLGAQSTWVTGQVFGIDGGLARVKARA